MRASVVFVLTALVSGAVLADDAPPPPAPLETPQAVDVPLADDAVAPDAAPTTEPPAPSTEAPPAAGPETAPETAPSSSAAASDTVGSSIPTWLFTVPLGCATFAAVWSVASAVLAPLNAVAGLGGVAALVLAAVSSSYVQVALGDYVGKRRGAVLPGALASGCTTTACTASGLVVVTAALYGAFFAAFGVLVTSVNAGNVDPRLILAQLGAAGLVVVGLAVVGYVVAIFGSMLAGQGASALAYQLFAEPLEEGDDGGFEIPGFLRPVHPGAVGDDREDAAAFAPPKPAPSVAVRF